MIATINGSRSTERQRDESFAVFLFLSAVLISERSTFLCPKHCHEKIVFTIVMATIMVYGMIVYNVALNTGGVTNATFGMALHEMPIMVPVAFVLEFFVVGKAGHRPGVHLYAAPRTARSSLPMPSP